MVDPCGRAGSFFVTVLQIDFERGRGMLPYLCGISVDPLVLIPLSGGQSATQFFCVTVGATAVIDACVLCVDVC